ncbi:MAG: helix-turn-helix domain-containing protein [Proteobacteria bacterium]|nr:helix-turn-helix domain-containing protein [Pseudomonadota bacterium]
MATFGEELIQSAREALDIARGNSAPAFVCVPDEVDVAAIRKRKKMSQGRFAETYGLSVSTVRDWEQKRRAPDRSARVLLTVIDREPRAVVAALGAVSA